MDLVIEDGSRVQVVYFLMSEDNVRAADRAAVGELRLRRGVDGARRRVPEDRARTRAPTATSRALLGKYVRDEKVIPLEDAIRKLTSLPATTLRDQAARPPRARLLRRRRRLRSGDDRRTTRRSRSRTSTRPACVHVFVNGVQVLKDGEHTGAKPGRVVRGPGRKKP